MTRPPSTGVIILAAGESSRLGHPKQQLIFRESTLLQRAIKSALRSPCRKPIVVLGAFHERLVPAIDPHLVDIVINPDWKEGMASSIKAGINAMIEKDQPEQVIFMVCDQPFADENLLSRLISTQQHTEKSIVACTYQGTLGVPALFDQKFFPPLLKLRGKEGAKKIINAFPEDVVPIPFSLGHIDIDTAEDYQALLKNDRK